MTACAREIVLSGKRGNGKRRSGCEPSRQDKNNAPELNSFKGFMAHH